jgi:4-hydroxy-3-methylbut-2-en-1-yl diphosphate synthase IspG/GcpE
MSSLTIFTVKQTLVMKIRPVIRAICCLLLISCSDDKSTSESLVTEKANQKNVITAKAIENFEYTDYVLSSNAEDVVADWEKYQELALQIGYLKKADFSFFTSEKLILKTFFQDFRTNIPDQLVTNTIESRMVIIETMLLKLNENLTIDNIDISIKLSGIKDVLEAFSNLNYQINRKVEFDVYDKIKPE